MNRTLGNYKTKQNLSSTTIFHFTNTLDILKSILKNGFQVRFIYEKLPGTKLAYLTNTVCFCDIPLSSIKEHINWYGEYGIGISRKIATQLQLTPVFYIHSKSRDIPKGSSIKNIEWFENFPFTRYLKQVRGKQMFFDEKNKPYWKWKKFYDEKEWRYFPNNPILKISKYTNEIELDNLRKQLNDNKNLEYLLIKPEWIEYIIIKDAKEIKDLKSVFPDNEYYDILLTKIITVKQILNDF